MTFDYQYFDDDDYSKIEYLSTIIDDGRKYAKRGLWEIGLGGYDQGYVLSCNGVDICSVNFEYMEMKDFGNCGNKDIKIIKSIFEDSVDGINGIYGEKLRIVE